MISVHPFFDDIFDGLCAAGSVTVENITLNNLIYKAVSTIYDINMVLSYWFSLVLYVLHRPGGSMRLTRLEIW